MKNKYIGLRVGMAFAVLLALLLGIGQSGLRRVQEINATLNDITGRRSAKLQLSREAFELSNQNSRITMEIFLVRDKARIETLLATRSENSKKVSQLLAEMGSRCESEEEKHLLAEANGTRHSYVESYLRALHLLVDEKKHDAAAAVMVNETLALLLKYHGALDQIVEFQQGELDRAVKQAQADYIKTHRLASLLALLSATIALGIAVFTTRQAQKIFRQDAAARESVEFELQRSEERMRMAMEAAKIGFWDLDVIKDEHVWSDTCKVLLGVPRDSSASYQALINAVHPDDWEMMRAKIDEALQEKRDYAVEFRVVWPDNSVHWRMSTGQAFYDDAGHVKRMSGVTMDIDERKYAEERLHLQAAALGAAANAIVITDFRGAIVWVNDAFTTMTGYSKEEVLGKNPRLLKSGEQPDGYYASLWSTISSGKVWRGEIVNRRKDGTNYAEEMTITPVTQDGIAYDTHFVAIKQDITERRRTQDALVESEERYRSLFENMLEGFAYCEMLFDERGCPIDFVYLAVNSAFGKLTGLENVVGKRVTEVIPGIRDSQRDLFERYGRVVLTGEPERFEIEVKALGIWFSISAYAAGSRCFVATFDNITERKQSEEALLFNNALLEAQTETAIDGILVVDGSDQIILANRQFGRNFEIPDELLSTRDDLIVRKYVADKVENPEAFIEKVKYLNSQRDEKSRDELRFKNGKRFDRYSAPLVDSKCRYRGRIWYFRDITDRKIAEERVQFLAYYDALTGLPNRTLLQDRLSKALATARRQKHKVALLFVDLDRFKNINDSLGHSFGDLFLQEVAERLKRWAREQDTVARVGGDEFLVVLTNVREIPDAAVAAERLTNAMAAEFAVQGRHLRIGCSIGISIFPEHGTDGETLIKNADAAMYSAKDRGGNNVQFFTQDMNVQVVERLTLENSLRLALEKRELSLVYQPQMDIATGRIIGLEALLRWQHRELGLVPPDKFIGIAENSGLIMPIGEWVLRTACAQARKWQDDGFIAVPVAVNVSAVQFRQEGFCELIRKVLHETGLASKYLELELTESLLLTSGEVTLSVIQELKGLGVELAIDDFGTGYSSFSYLRQFRVGKLKIDRSFIRDVAANCDDAAITAAIISMAKSLNLKVIAEGVEDEAQMSFLRAHHCDEIQGYYFSKPLSADEVAAKLRADCSEAHVNAQASGKQS